MTGGPSLPDGVDAQVATFVDCRSDRLELTAGPVHWLPMPPGVPSFLGHPKAAFEGDGQAVRATVRWGLASVGLRAAIRDGYLDVETTGFAFGLEGAVGRWVDSMNDQLRASGRRLAQISMRGDDVVIVKRPHDVATPG